LGLVVFPVEGYFDNEVESLSLDKLEAREWPRWQFGPEGKSLTLGHLLRKLRNATAHRHVSFSSESRTLELVALEFWNERTSKDGEKVRNWRARIEAKDLRTFCDRLTVFMLSR
jgi:hypothetical protein